MTLGVGEGQELLQFLGGLEGIRGKLIERTDRPGTLRGKQLRDRQARTGLRVATDPPWRRRTWRGALASAGRIVFPRPTGSAMTRWSSCRWLRRYSAGRCSAT